MKTRNNEIKKESASSFSWLKTD